MIFTILHRGFIPMFFKRFREMSCIKEQLIPLTLAFRVPYLLRGKTAMSQERLNG